MFKLKLTKKEFNGKVYKIVDMHYASAVVILNSEKTHMLLVSQHRPVVNDFTWEIPAGMLDVEGESARHTAIREVKEETGIDIDFNDLEVVTHYYPIIGCVNHKIYIFEAIVPDMTLVETNDNDVVQSKWFSFEEIDKMINDSAIIDGKTILAFYKTAYETLKAGYLS